MSQNQTKLNAVMVWFLFFGVFFGLFFFAVVFYFILFFVYMKLLTKVQLSKYVLCEIC